MRRAKNWFEVDRAGLRDLVAGRDRRFIVHELIANAFDEPGVTRCDVRIERDGRNVIVQVEDDAPEGFSRITDAYTLYGSTRKRANATVRGRFNVGEKLVLALARHATISTTTGTVVFGPEGRSQLRSTRAAGSMIEVSLQADKDTDQVLAAAARSVLSPATVRLTVNGETVTSPDPLATASVTLTTVLARPDGTMAPTRRITEIRVYNPSGQGILYEMGIPVMETGDRWSVDVNQKIPLSMDRDVVRPAWLRDVRAEVLNLMASQLEDNECSATWVRDGMSDQRITDAAVRTVADKRWGTDRVVLAPGDTHAWERAISNGYAIVGPRDLSRDEWDQVRRAQAIPSGQDLWPRNFADAQRLPRDAWTPGMKRIERLTLIVGHIANIHVQVSMVDAPKASTLADYCDGHVRFNVGTLGADWFDLPMDEVLPLIIHEIGHAYGGHYNQTSYDGLAELGARLALSAPIKEEAWIHGS